MSVYEIIRFAFRGLFTNRLRTFLTVLGITIGVASVIILLAVGNGSSKAIQSSLDRLGTNSLQVRSGGGGFGFRARATANSQKPLTILDTVALTDKTQAPDIKQVAPIVSTNGTCVVGSNTSSPSTFYGTWPAYYEASNTSIQSGSYFTNDDVTQARRVALIGQTTATALFGTESPIGQTMRCSGIQFTVIGLTAKKGASGFQDGDSLVLIPITTMENTITGNQALSSILVEATKSTTTTAAQTELTTILDARHGITGSNSADFSVFNQASSMVINSGNTVPLAASGNYVSFFRLGTNVRLAVRCDPAIVTALNSSDGLINSQTLYWDITNYQISLVTTGGNWALPTSIKLLSVQTNSKIVSWSSPNASWAAGDAAIILI